MELSKSQNLRFWLYYVSTLLVSSITFIFTNGSYPERFLVDNVLAYMPWLVSGYMMGFIPRTSTQSALIFKRNVSLIILPFMGLVITILIRSFTDPTNLFVSGLWGNYFLTIMTFQFLFSITYYMIVPKPRLS